jgi:hypothetical protein
MQKIKSPAKNRSGASKAADLSPWQRICPSCRAITHVRKKVCACGHKFPSGPRAMRT